MCSTIGSQGCLHIVAPREQDQLMKSAQHIIAALSALLLLLASIFQARRSMVRAEEKVTDEDYDLKAYISRKRWWPLWLRGRIPIANGELASDAKHLVHIARLWELIIFGSAIALSAELFDFLIDQHVFN
jgi:hypothetical protein